MFERFFGFKPKEIKKKKNPSPQPKKPENIEKKFKRLLKNGYSINQARYFSKH